jgi:hypothetical protein
MTAGAVHLAQAQVPEAELGHPDVLGGGQERLLRRQLRGRAGQAAEDRGRHDRAGGVGDPAAGPDADAHQAVLGERDAAQLLAQQHDPGRGALRQRLGGHQLEAGDGVRGQAVQPGVPGQEPARHRLRRAGQAGGEEVALAGQHQRGAVRRPGDVQVAAEAGQLGPGGGQRRQLRPAPVDITHGRLGAGEGARVRPGERAEQVRGRQRGRLRARQQAGGQGSGGKGAREGEGGAGTRHGWGTSSGGTL